MKWLRRYNESQLIKATDNNFIEIIQSEISKLGNESDLNHIDVSGVTNMLNAFNKSKFNGDISRWDVGNVIDMHGLFEFSKFNGDISNWNVQNLKRMPLIFYGSQFNGDISNWDVQNLLVISYAFSESKFEGDLNLWNTRKLLSFVDAFYESPLKNKEPWWYSMIKIFDTNRFSKFPNQVMWESIDVYLWINTSKKIIWKKRLNYAIQDFGDTKYIFKDSEFDPNEFRDARGILRRKNFIEPPYGFTIR